MPAAGWVFSLDAQAFLNGNLQARKFRDFHVVESQNWLMARASRAVGRARLTLHGMFSAEPWTLRAIGSSQVLNLLSAGGYHPPGLFHDHTLSQMAALTAGYERQLPATRAGAFALGGDATVYVHDASLDDNYGTPFSAHIVLRYRFAR